MGCSRKLHCFICALFVEDMIGFESNKMARALSKSMIVALMWTDKQMHPQDIF